MSADYKTTIKDKQNEAKQIMTADQLKKCHGIIHTATAISAASGAIPVPVADALPISAAQVTMVISLGNVFNQTITESAAKAAIAVAAATFFGRSLVKMIPLIGWGISAVVAAGVTEAIGWTAAVDYAKNAKAAWFSDHYPGGESRRSSTERESETPEHDENCSSLDMLAQRAEALIAGNVDATEFSVELKAVIREIENRLHENEIPENHPLLKLYDALSELL